jgi:predicted Zn-dependent peptidase
MKPEFYRKVLKNGLTVLFEKRPLPVVSVAFAVKCGGVNESENEKGISHFIEHLLYKGTKKRNVKQIAEEIEKNGGELNGFTDEEITAYWCKMPSKHINVALDVLGDMIKNPLFDEKEIEKERKVIFEEIKMRKDNPRIYVYDQIQTYLYENPFGMLLIGNLNTMNSIDREKLVKRFKEAYSPENIILCVVGYANFEKIINFAEKLFPENTEKGKIPKFKIILKNKTKIEKRKGIDQANLIFAHHCPLSDDKKTYAAHVLNGIMAVGMSSRLFSEIREKRNLAYGVKGDSVSNKDYAYNIIYVGTTKENVEQVKKLIIKEFKDVADNLSERELQQVKEQLIGNYHIGFEDSQNQMINLLLNEINGNAEDFYKFEKNISEVKLKDVKELAKKAIEKYSFFALIPQD